MGLNCPLGPHQRFIRNAHIAYNSTNHLCFLGVKFQLLNICHSWLLRRTQLVLVQDLIGPFCWEGRGLGVINPENKVRLSENFDHSKSIEL